MVDTPTTVWGWIVGITLVVVGVFALYTTGIGPLLVVAAVVAVAAYIVWTVLYRIHRRLTRGRLLPRRGGGE